MITKNMLMIVAKAPENGCLVLLEPWKAAGSLGFVHICKYEFSHVHLKKLKMILGPMTERGDGYG